MGRLCPNNKNRRSYAEWVLWKRQWPLTWCTVIHARGEDCKYYFSRAEPEDAAQIMGRLALASKTMTKGGWPEEMQGMQ